MVRAPADPTMAAMRNDVRPQLLAASAGTLLALTLLTACTGPPVGTASEPPVVSPPEPTASASSPTPPLEATEPADVPSAAPNTVEAQPGDCQFDPSSPSTVTFVVTSYDDLAPIELTYSAFRPGVVPETRTASTFGPSIVVLQTDCGEYPDPSSPWEFTASSDGALTCALFYGAMPLGSDTVTSDEAGFGGNRVDCSATPGM
jgi:hypothetical protein